jgi:NADP-dependent 3-hydroxy acid dehydrogenase YdfG
VERAALVRRYVTCLRVKAQTSPSNYGSRDDLAQIMSKKIEAHGRRAFSAKVSVIDRHGMKKLTRELVEKWGGIDILVNNAAINRGDNFATTTDSRLG